MSILSKRKTGIFTFCIAVGSFALAASPASAQEIFAGVAAHGVDTPFTLKTFEEGADIQIGVRSQPIEGLKLIGKPSAYLFGSVNTAGDTNLVATGLSWKIGKQLYVRPGIGLAVHDGPKLRYDGPDDSKGRRTDLGSRILFEPEIGVGYQIDPRFSIEAHWSHVSHARLFNSKQNPGLDMIGARVNVRF